VVVGRAPVPPAGRPHRTGGPSGRTGGTPNGSASAKGDESTTLGLAHSLNVLPVADTVDSPQQRARQSAARRYD
jgi:hypothetical protein